MKLEKRDFYIILRFQLILMKILITSILINLFQLIWIIINFG